MGSSEKHWSYQLQLRQRRWLEGHRFLRLYHQLKLELCLYCQTSDHLLALQVYLHLEGFFRHCAAMPTTAIELVGNSAALAVRVILCQRLQLPLILLHDKILSNLITSFASVQSNNFLLRVVNTFNFKY